MLMDSNINENQSVFMITKETSSDQFLRFTKNRLVTIQKIQILRDFEKLEKSSDKLEKMSENQKN
jgi:hypothetical protein